MEEGEVKEPGSRKPFVKKVCRFYNEGKCTWGSNCRFVHPGVNDKGNYSLIDRRELHQATAKLLNIPQAPPAPAPPPAFPPPPLPSNEPVVESAWERGLRHAKEIRKKALMRKEQDHNFEEKRMLGDIPYEEERDFDKENDFSPPQGNSNSFEEFYGYSIADDEAPPRDNREGFFPQFEVYNTRYERPEHPEHPEPPPQFEYHRPEKERPWRAEREPVDRRDTERQRQREINRMRERPRDIMRERRSPPRPLSRERPLPGNDRPPMREDRAPPRVEKEMGPPPPGRADRPADAWQDPWARSRSPKTNAKTTGKRRRSYSYSSDSFSDSSFSSRSRSRSRSHSSYSSSSRSSSGSSYSRSSFSRSRSRSRSRSAASRNRRPAGGVKPSAGVKQAPGTRPATGAKLPSGVKQPIGRSDYPQGRGGMPPGKAGHVGGRGNMVEPGNRGAPGSKSASTRGPIR